MASDDALRKAGPAEVDPDDVVAQVRAVTDKVGVKRREIPFGYKPHRKQAIAHYVAKQPEVDTVVLNCGRRAGKSEWSVAEFIDRVQDDYHDKRLGRGRWSWQGPQTWQTDGGANDDPFLHYVCIAPIYKLLDPLKRKFKRLLGMANRGGLIVSCPKNGDWWLVGGIRIDWRTGDNPDNLVADAYDGVLLDEFARLKPDVWEDNLQPALADSGGWAVITSTPLSKASAFYRLWATGSEEAARDIFESTGERIAVSSRVRCCYWTTMDNTANPRIRQWALEAKGRMPAPMWKRNFMASWVAFKGQILVELDEAVHRRLWDPAKLRRITAGMDFGWKNPAVFSVWGDDYDAGVHEVESHSAKQFPIDTEQGWQNRRGRIASCWTAVAFKALDHWAQHCSWANSWRDIPIFFPHDSPGSVDQFARRGFNCQPAYLDRLDGLEFFQRRIHQGHRYITIASPAIWRSFESLVHPENATGRNAELWCKAKSDDHGFDAGRYALSERIEQDATVNPSTGMPNWFAR